MSLLIRIPTKSKARILLIRIVILLTTSSPILVFSELGENIDTAPESPIRHIEEIIVSATPARRSIQKTLHSVEVFSAEQLSVSTARNFDELVAVLPNVEIGRASCRERV